MTLSTELARLAEAATPGPWELCFYDAGDREHYDHNGPCPSIQAPESEDCAVVHWDGFKQRYWSSANGNQRQIEANAAMIVALRNNLPAIISALKAAETPLGDVAGLANEAWLDAKAFREHVVYDSEGDPIRLTQNAARLDQYADAIEALTHQLAERSDWFAGDVDCDGEPLTTIPTHEYTRLVTDCEKFRDQVRDTCTRAEKAEGQLAERDAENKRLRAVVVRYGDRIRMAMAPAELQQTIDEALGGDNGK